jgi:hypothetical protein
VWRRIFLQLGLEFGHRSAFDWCGGVFTLLTVDLISSFQQFQVLDTLFQMLACTFPVRLKAELFTAVTCWVQGRPSEASQVWDRLESMQVTDHDPDPWKLASASRSGFAYSTRIVVASVSRLGARSRRSQ